MLLLESGKHKLTFVIFTIETVAERDMKMREKLAKVGGRERRRRMERGKGSKM